MKIKKKDLRKREAQLPINYPDPIVEQPQETLDERKTRVEQLCKRLAHNEVTVRDAALAQVPSYVQNATARLLKVEADADQGALLLFFGMRRKRKGKNVPGSDEVALNVLRELDVFRELEGNSRREQKRMDALQRLRRQQHEGGCSDNTKNGDDDSLEGQFEGMKCEKGIRNSGRKSVRQVYREWITPWAEVELLLLKLSRGLFFCLWHSDKPLVQLECAQNIARVIHAPHTNSGKLLWLSCMMRVLAREWRTMDRYRSDKYLAFVRRLMFELFILMRGWEEETLQEQQRTETGGSHSGVSSEEQKVLVEQAVLSEANASTSNVSGSEIHVEKDGVASCQPLCRMLDEVSYIFQHQVIAEPTAVGLTMHICDVFFDELCRSHVSPTLFVALGDRIALYAMSKGNFVEKRTLDYFIAPIAGGVLEEQLRAQHEQQQQNKRGTSEEVACGVSPQVSATPTCCKRARNSADTLGKDSKKKLTPVERAAKEAHSIITALADCCRRYSVARGTFYSVRPMFAESEISLRQAASASDYVELSDRDLRPRLEREIEEADEKRAAVAEERRKMRLLKRKGGRSAAFSSKRKTRLTDGEKRKSKGGRGAKVLEKAKKQPARNTKRKKNYTLTKEDLYGGE